ncbi:MAG: methyltransferase [Thermodesulfobacteriota bacterium]|nr:MAG: methyltransferase [Thermodesulfobacteriota bacterium]
MSVKPVNVENIGPYSYMGGAVQGITTDTLLLADFVLPVPEGATVVDIGTGGGIIPLILASRSPVKRIVGVDIMAGAALAARLNVERNNLSSRIEIIECDYRVLPERFAPGTFTHVISNPPYMKASCGRISVEKERAAARAEVFGSLAELAVVSAFLAGNSGSVYFVFPVKRLVEMISGLQKAGLRPVRIKFVHSGQKKACKIFLVEARARGGLKVEEPVFL